MTTESASHEMDRRAGLQSNVDLLRSGYAALVGGDETRLSLLTDDVVLHIPGRGPLAGTRRGKREVVSFEGKLMERSAGTFRIEVVDVLANGDHGVVLTRHHAERHGRILDMPVVHVWTFREGRLSGLRVYPGDQHVVDDFWL